MRWTGADEAYVRPDTGTAAPLATRSPNARRTLHTGADLVTDKRPARLRKWFASDACVAVEETWEICQRMIATDRARGRELTIQLIASLSQGVLAAPTEVIRLGRTLTKRAADMLADFDPPGTSNGPTEAINGRLEHLRGSALGFRSPTNDIARSLLEAGGLKLQLHPGL